MKKTKFCGLYFLLDTQKYNSQIQDKQNETQNEKKDNIGGNCKL